MFSLYEITKIRLCRGLFIGLCLVPSVLVVTWCLVVHLAIYTRTHERAIAARLGLQANLTRASWPQPDTLLYEGLELRDPHTRQLLARLPFVEIRDTGTLVQVRLPYPAMVNGTRLDAFWKVMHDQAEPSRARATIQFAAQNLTLHLNDGDQSFTDLDGEVDNTADQTRLRLAFRGAGALPAANAGAALTIAWKHDPVAPTSTIHFASGPSPLACSILASVWPAVEQMGRASTFAGRISVFETRAGWKTQLAGRLTGVELDRAVGGRFTHKLTGTAEATLEAVTIENGRIESAAGKLTAGPGVISRSLIDSAAAHLRVQPTSDVGQRTIQPLAYTQMCVNFAVNSNGLTAHGAIPGAADAILVNERNVLVRQPAIEWQPVVNLVRALVPQNDVQVPFTRETDALTRALPSPSIFKPPGEREPLPQAKAIGVRSGGTKLR